MKSCDCPSVDCLLPYALRGIATRLLLLLLLLLLRLLLLLLLLLPLIHRISLIVACMFWEYIINFKKRMFGMAHIWTDSKGVLIPFCGGVGIVVDETIIKVAV